MARPSRRAALAGLIAATALAGGYGLTRPKLYRLYCGSLAGGTPPPDQLAPRVHEALFDPGQVPFQSCHASTIAGGPSGLFCAWFGGSAEGAPDTRIFLSHRDDDGWSPPLAVADSGTTSAAVWNPVLWITGHGLPLLFYKLGTTPAKWTGMVLTLDMGGLTHGLPRALPPGFLGPTKNKPLLLADGRLLCPSSSESGGWSVHFEWTGDGGAHWQKSAPVQSSFDIIQPTLLRHPGGRLQALCRSRQGVIVETWSSDGGRTWSTAAATGLANPNSGIDAVTLADGRHLLAYNPSASCRSPLSLAISADGKVWRNIMQVDMGWGEYSYPAIIQAADGLVHLSYTRQRLTINHLTIDPARL